MLKAKNKNRIKLNQNFDLMSSSECKCHKRCLLTQVIMKKLESSYWIQKKSRTLTLNLLKNSSEASSITGKIKIKTSFNSNKITSFSKEDVPSTLPLQIEIIDYGKGISKHMLPNIFDPFVSSQRTDLK